MKKINILIFAMMVLIAGMGLTGCGGGGVRVQSIDYAPDLHRFDIIDSYGVDTANSSAALALSPYVDNGLFDIDWQVNSLEDYQVNVRINDHPSVDNSYLFYSKICGVGRACDQSGSAVCEYTSDYTLSCNNDNHPTDISSLFRHAPPQKLYVVLEVCNYSLTSCVYDYYPVAME